MNRPAHFICRVGFLLLCVLPTAVVGGWIVQRSQPGFLLSARQEWEQELSRQLGLRVTCTTVEYPRPNTAELSNVVITDSETGAAVASARSLELIYTSERWKLAGAQIVIETAQLPLLRTQLEQRMLRRETSTKLPNSCEIWLREITLRSEERGLTLIDVAGEWKMNENGPSCALSFRLPESDSQQPSGQWMVQRNRQTTPPSTLWQLKTGNTPLPCSVAAAAWPAVRQLGPGAQFAGELEVVQAANEFSGQLRGTLFDVDLDSLVSEQLPHRLSGLAICKIAEARIERNQLTLVRGTCQAKDGSISASLLASAAEHLQLAGPPTESLATNSVVPFRQLSLGFDLRAAGLQLTGSADPLRKGVLLATATGSLLGAPPQHHAQATGLLNALVPTSERMTRQGQYLAGLLPVAEGQTPHAVARQPQHFPLRMHPSRDSQSPALRQPQMR
ncbi:hypothetical protein [Anatilimnocola floriformis]|uniref:hypothetical protein n=1 Tax=Anatilimnocola floriformis TaxID=2948575 RepID=UPI0020C596E6|nr:hypothetical protein [Anatilimnocola floriformis]